MAPPTPPSNCKLGLPKEQEEEGWSFTVQAVWLPKYASRFDQLEIWFSILLRLLLTPNDFPNRETLQQRLLDFIAHYNCSAKPINWSYTVAQMKEKFALVLMQFCTKKLEYCERYPLQLAAYCGCINRMYGTKIKHGVIVVALPLPNTPAQVFQFELGDYWQRWLDRLVAY